MEKIWRGKRHYRHCKTHSLRKGDTYLAAKRSKDHEMVCVGKDLKGHPVPTPLPWAGKFSLDEIVP